jgi:topoisomerase-4 subunit A
MILIEKYDPEKVFTAVYEDTKTKSFYVKRFTVEVTERKMDFIGEEDKNKLVLLTADKYPRLDVAFDMKLKTKGTEKEEIIVHEFIGVKGFKAKGKRISLSAVKKIDFLEPLIIDEPEEEVNEEGEEEELLDEAVQLISDEEDVNGEVQNEIKEEKVKSKGKEKKEIKKDDVVITDEDKEEDKKKDDNGDAIQMELPL